MSTEKHFYTRKMGTLINFQSWVSLNRLLNKLAQLSNYDLSTVLLCKKHDAVIQCT